ncbi:hypothetical protein MASR2M47_37420 [Draconibacterium sp.]
MNEQAIHNTVNDFQKLCRYIDENKPVLTKQKIQLGKKALFEINALLHYRRDVAAPNYQQESYPVIDLMCNMAMLGKLYRYTVDGKGNISPTANPSKVEFDQLNIFEQYAFLFETFWCTFDLLEIIRFGANPVERVIEVFASSKPGKELKKGAFSKRRDNDPMFSYLSALIHYFSYFGLCDIIPVVEGDKKLTRYDDSIQVIISTEFGINFCKILHGQEIVRWNKLCIKEFGFFSGDVRDDPDFVPLYKLIAPIFPEGSINNTVSTTSGTIKGTYVFKVSLAANVWRKIKLSHLHTLLDLHDGIQDAFGFDDDHLYSFFMDGKLYSRNVYESPNSENGPYVDEVRIGELELYEGQRILYLFDYGDSWEFNVLLEKIDKDSPLPLSPIISEKKGKAPEQYGNYWD